MGEFHVGADQRHENQCGQEGTQHYNYKVSISGDSEHLDSQGFLIDNMVIKQYFEQTYEIKQSQCKSCEDMACRAIEWIQKFCKENGVEGITRIYVELWGSEKSFIQAEWKIW